MPNMRGHILVVDDYPMNRMKLSRFLQQQGHTTTLAENGKQAVAEIKKTPFDLMLLDIEMPEMDGYQVLAYLKQQNMLRDLPVIVISAADEMESVVKCIEMGAEDHLPKPFNPTLLNARIGACLEKKRLRDLEVEYLNNVALVTKAAGEVEANTFSPESLADVALRQDELGRLARVFGDMVREVRAREAQLQHARDELQILNQAKAKMIDHLSHELKTPLAIIATSIKLLSKPHLRQDEERFLRVLARIEQYLRRLVELETEASDIAENRHFSEQAILEHMISHCQDVLSALVEDYDPPDALLDALRKRVAEIYLPEDHAEQIISLHRWIPLTMQKFQPVHAHREIYVELDIHPTADLKIQESLLQKAFGGLVRNAFENTPDGGTIRIALGQHDDSLYLAVQDFGVGIDEEFQPQLFHGFVHAGDTKDYSSGTAYEFGAGGQGLDLLRTKLYAERLGFHIGVESRRCVYITPDSSCPGNIQMCPFCSSEATCRESGGSVFTLEFPNIMLCSEQAI